MNPYWLIFILISITACSQIEKRGLASPLSWNHCYSAFEKHVVEVSGDEAKDCGFFTVSATESVKAEVRECLKEQINKNMPFRVGHQRYGDDSMFCDVAIQDSTGKYWSFFYDSDISGGNGGMATIWVSECQAIKMAPGAIAQDSFFSFIECKDSKDIKSALLAK